MEILLKNDFTAHHNLKSSTVTGFSNQTSAVSFELKDDATLIYTTSGDGVAKYENSDFLNVSVINYEAFINSLSKKFRENRKKCDLIVYTDNNRYFLLNELTDTLPKYVLPFTNTKGVQPGKLATAKQQLLGSLTDLSAVPTIQTFINSFIDKRCCFFNKQASAPSILNVTTAFNRNNTLTKNGFKMANPDIEALGFDYYEYYGGQFLNLAQ